MNEFNYCSFLKPEKDYCKFFSLHINQGNKIASAVVISSALTPFSLAQNPLLNRLIEVGTYNIIQQSFMPIKICHYENYTNTENPFFRGIFQTNKNLANIWTQNYLKLNNHELKSLDFTYGFLYTTSGMGTFFLVGAINSKLPSEEAVLIFNSVLASSYLHTSLKYSPETTMPGHLNSVLLSNKGMLSTYAGNIGSFLALDIAQNIYDQLPYKAPEFTQTQVQASLNTLAVIILSTRYLSTPESSAPSSATSPAIAAFIAVPFARATIFTAVEISYDLYEIISDFVDTSLINLNAKLDEAIACTLGEEIYLFPIY